MIKEARETSKRVAARCLGVDTKRVWEWVVNEDKLGGMSRKRQRMDGVGIYLAPLLNLPPRGAYPDAKPVVQQLHLLNAQGADMVIPYMVSLLQCCFIYCFISTWFVLVLLEVY